MMYLHIMRNDKFNKAYIQFINNNFNMEEHLFIFLGGISEDTIKIIDRPNVYKINNNQSIINKLNQIIKLIKLMNVSDKIYIHNLYTKSTILLLYLQPWILKKSNWIIWGADLYEDIYSNEMNISIKRKILNKIKGRVAKNIGEISTLTKGDYDLAKNYYKSKAKYKKGFYMLPSTCEDLDNIRVKNIKKSSNTVYIQIGNSATSTNNHIEILDMLKKFKNEDIRIFAPLSYGNNKYAKLISDYGKQIFNDKFIPMLDFMSYDEYTDYLNSIDIAIFNNNRQQALGNIYSLLYLGKKVYIRKDTTMWTLFEEELQVKLYDVLDISDENLLEFTNYDKKIEDENRINISKVFIDEYAIDIWKRNFEENNNE